MTDNRYAELLDNTESILLKLKAMNHLQKVLLRETKGFRAVLFKRVGAGLTSQQFEGLVQILVEQGFCIREVGRHGAVTLSLSQAETSEVA